MKQSLSLTKITPRHAFATYFPHAVKHRYVPLKALIGTAALTLILSSVVFAQRRPKAQAAPTQVAPAMPMDTIRATVAFVQMFGTPTIIELSPEQAAALERMTPEQQENFFRQQIETTTRGVMRHQLQEAGVGDSEVQDAIWNFIQTEEKKFQHLRELKGQLTELLGDSKDEKANGDALKSAFDEVKKEAETAQKQYAVDLAELDKKIHYSDSPRLTAVLDTFGLLKQAPFFSLGLSFMELANTKLLASLKAPNSQPTFTLTAANAVTAGDDGGFQMDIKPLSPKEQLKAIGVRDSEVQDAVLSFVEVQEEKHKKLRELKTRLIKLLGDNKDDRVLKDAFDEAKKEGEVDQKQYVVDLADLDAKIHYLEDTRLSAALDSLGLLGKDSTLTFGLSIFEMLELKTRIYSTL